MQNPLATQYQRAAALAEFRSPAPRPPFERIGVYATDGVQWQGDHAGTWRAVWQRGYLPTPGAMDMAWMSLGLGPVPICGPGFDVQGPRWRAFQPEQAFSPQTLGVSGLPTAHGQVFNQPLTAPQAYQAPASDRGGV
jgi:hypothetical protein